MNKKIAIFNNVEKTMEALGQVGIGKMRRWWTDATAPEFGYSSACNYYDMHVRDGANPNNLALYLEGSQEDKVNLAKLVLNINDLKTENETIIDFAEYAKKMLVVLGVPIPDGFGVPLVIPKQKTFDLEDCTVKIFLEQSRIETWKVIVTSK